jgi:hypothetical protein
MTSSEERTKRRGLVMLALMLLGLVAFVAACPGNDTHRRRAVKPKPVHVKPRPAVKKPQHPAHEHGHKHDGDSDHHHHAHPHPHMSGTDGHHHPY